MFEDVPLDTRHHHTKVQPKFPKEWRMNESRREELREIRQKALALDEAKRVEGTLIDGKEVLKKFLTSAPEPAQPEPAMARRGSGPPRIGRGR